MTRYEYDDADGEPIAQRVDWGCETTAVIARHFGVEYPVAPPDVD